MNNTYQLYLKLDKLADGLFLNQVLQEVGFKNFKRTGSDPSNFRNYYYHFPEAPNQMEIHFRILPNETKVSTITIQLYFSCPLSTIKNLFSRLAFMKEITSFQLLDLELRNRHFTERHTSKKITSISFADSEKEEKRADRSAYIPISYKEFVRNNSKVEKRKQFFLKKKIKGEKAPDDHADAPRARG